MKQIRLIAFLALCAFACQGIFGETYSSSCGENVTWTLDTSTGVMTISGTGAMNDWPSDVMPWHDVTASICTVIIEKGVKSIGDYAFYWCRNLTSVTLPEGVTSIGNRAFSDCSSLTSITIPEGVTNIGEYTFYKCSSLTVINIPEGVTSIGHYAFYGCSSLTSITIPEGVTSIGHYAFYGCSSLTSIIIPESVTSIGSHAFAGVSNTNVTINCPTVGDWFSGVSIASVTLGEKVTNIAKNAFYNCYSLTSITIPKGVTSIGDDAFNGCYRLTSITIPEGVTSIGERAFFLCGLTSIIIPEGVTSIEHATFYLCNLTSITLPESVTSIKSNTFCNCSGLTSIVIPKAVTSIGDEAFYGCDLKNIYFNSNPSIGNDALPQKTKLHLSLSEEANFNNTNANTYTDATYERVLADGKYGTIIFPFAIDDDTKESYEFYELEGQEGGRLNFTPVDDPQPGTPYLYKNAEGKKADCLTSGGSVTICTTMSDKDAGDGWTMKGNYESLVITDADELDVTYYLSNNKVMNATTSLTLKPFRAYFQGPSYAATFADAGVKNIAIRTGEGTTLVSPETMEEVPAVYYDLSGRAVANPQSGIYIVNGKKLMVK